MASLVRLDVWSYFTGDRRERGSSYRGSVENNGCTGNSTNTVSSESNNTHRERPWLLIESSAVVVCSMCGHQSLMAGQHHSHHHHQWSTGNCNCKMVRHFANCNRSCCNRSEQRKKYKKTGSVSSSTSQFLHFHLSFSLVIVHCRIEVIYLLANSTNNLAVFGIICVCLCTTHIHRLLLDREDTGSVYERRQTAKK